MEKLSKLELERLYEILNNIFDVVCADDAGITWGLEEDLLEARAMVRKALTTK